MYVFINYSRLILIYIDRNRCIRRCVCNIKIGKSTVDTDPTLHYHNMTSLTHTSRAQEQQPAVQNGPFSSTAAKAQVDVEQRVRAMLKDHLRHRPWQRGRWSIRMLT